MWESVSGREDWNSLKFTDGSGNSVIFWRSLSDTEDMSSEFICEVFAFVKFCDELNFSGWVIVVVANGNILSLLLFWFCLSL